MKTIDEMIAVSPILNGLCVNGTLGLDANVVKVALHEFADRVAKNSQQPDVIKSVCGCIGTQLGRITNDKICGRCGKPKRE